MIRTQIQLTEQQLRQVRRAARERGLSVAEVIRRCIDRGVDGEIPDRNQAYARALGRAGAFRDRQGARDVSEKHDDYLDEAFR